MTIESQSAVTSCITCELKSRHLPLAPQVAQEGAQRANAHDVETVGGLVQQDRLRVVDERARNGDLHPLALRKALGAAVGDVGDAERPDELVDPRFERAGGQALQCAVVADVLPRGEARVEAARIRQDADAAANGIALVDDVVAVDARAAAVRDHQRREHAQERRLAGAVRSEEAR